jgi:hypothetical protein
MIGDCLTGEARSDVGGGIGRVAIPEIADVLAIKCKCVEVSKRILVTCEN